MAEKKFDIAILGSGPGGYTAAIRAAQLGMSVGLIEKKHLGGTCLNAGCIPAKALIQCATVYEQAKNGRQHGLRSTDLTADWSAVQKYRHRCIIRLRKGVETLMEKNRIEVIRGHGRLTGASTIDVEGTSVEAEHIVLAMGSYARSLPSLPVDGEKIITSDHALVLEKLPEKILIVGAGAVGCEFGWLFSTLGVDVTIVEFLERAIPMEDLEISDEVEKSLKRNKVVIHKKCAVEKVDTSGAGVVSTVKPRDGGDEFTVETDQVLVAVGRGPATDDCGLEEVGVPTEKGFIKVDEWQKTGVGKIRAIGDALGGLMLAHRASFEGLFVTEIIAGLERRPINYRNIPRATYSKPEIGSVGLYEHEAREQYGDDVYVGRFPFTACAKAVILGETTGFVKYVAVGKEKKLVGACSIGPHCTDIIAIAATAISLGTTAREFTHVVQAHPTLSEVWHEAAHDLFEGAINA
jgi:dihydrolipoamide dehydrogenase